jgi:hypothetical protein
LHHLADNISGRFVSGYGFCHKPVRRNIVNGHGTRRLAVPRKKAGPIGSGNGRVFGVVFIPVIRFFVGRKDGELQGRKETAKNLKSLGIAMEYITRATGLSYDEIAKL